jgi:outer membrane protein W
MKTFKYLKSLAIAVAFVAISLAFSDNANAQKAYKPYFGNVDWQFNAPFNNDFTNRASGWGASFEGGIYVTPKIGLGLFVSYSSNHKEIPTKTLYPNASSALTAEQERSLFQVPFGINARYRFYSNSDVCDPYIGMKLGTSYTQLSSYMSTFRVYDDSWGFYMSPEIGFTYFPFERTDFGFQFAVYYSFCTNRNESYDIKGINNLGFKLGIAF